MLNWLKLNLKVDFFNEVTCKKWIELLQWNMNEFWNEITIKMKCDEHWWTVMNIEIKKASPDCIGGIVKDINNNFLQILVCQILTLS